MEFVWGKINRAEKNVTLAFCLTLEGRKECELNLCAANAYRVFADGKFVNYGPERTAQGFSRVRKLALGAIKHLVIEVAGYAIACYANAYELPYFGAEVRCGGKIVANSGDFACRRISDRVQRVHRLSYQRNFAEYYKQRFDKGEFYKGAFDRYVAVETMSVPAPVCIEGNPDFATYKTLDFVCSGEGRARFDEEVSHMQYIWWETFADEGKMEGYSSAQLEADLVGEVGSIDADREGDLIHSAFALGRAETGFLNLRVCARTACKIYALFDEVLPDTENNSRAVRFARPVFHNAVAWQLEKGSYDLLTFEPYEMKYLSVFVSGDAEVKSARLVQYANGTANASLFCNDQKISAVFEAGKNSFCQNAVDIFMDCPGRERAGWLCDSFFTARAEQLLTGRSAIEQHFLENFILTREENLPHGMLPMCYPARQADGTFIPNWAMWYVLQLGEYFARTGDESMPQRAKERVYELIAYFDGFLNSDRLLEDLKGWIFVEWSVANDEDYVCGVNYPSNMLYARMLETAAHLYRDRVLKDRAESMKKTIARQSFNGTFFEDNAVRDGDGALTQTGHVSETCQYYALFCGIPCDDEFRARMLQYFGENRGEQYSYVGKSNAFIGNYLRLLWLLSLQEYGRARRECIDYFYYMAERTGTLWEYQDPEASCNHGFTSVVCVIIAEMLFGYRGFSARDKAIYLSTMYEKQLDAKITLPVGEEKIELILENGERKISNTTSFRIVQTE